MLIKALLQPWVSDIAEDFEVKGLATDDRNVKKGDVFFAIKGTEGPSKHYIFNAIDKGAVAIVHDAFFHPENFGVPTYAIPDMNRKLSFIASRFYGEPTKDMSVIGITGTNGKTTVAYLLTQAYEMIAPKQSFYVGTLGIGPIDDLVNTGMTTPGPVELQGYCAKFANENARFLSMEVSSHGLDQDRVTAIPFEQAIFTNLTHDHLDYHGTFEHYAAAKAKLFKFPSLKTILMNGDDPWMEKMCSNVNPDAKVYTFGVSQNVDIRLKNKTWTLEGMTLDLESPWGNVQLKSFLLGDFNVYNIMAVFGSLMAKGYDQEQVKYIISQLKPAPGRMEVVCKKPLVIVDYAHTPDALENALKTLNAFKQETLAGKLWVVFGCGGDRDVTKRPMMGKIACDFADKIVVTSDNPRHEDPEKIIAQVLQGISKQVINISDRFLAIQTCLSKASSNDIILIAGKGHEDYQQIGDEKTYFSDQSVVRHYYIG
ncbi:MAG: UDP-N-acetylmuramoyl-L-alanyl-D-glutamate--2,6-diaminopimelate ligase [Gammaproteobacteria bacterium]|nr:UDP-N-acetylmuramoyl-L-alanyl-D-glutamate--2,6-diaminopimelate ligase [Gammaproteobacteria bacterium]